eukprot:4269485-Pleurochrysis_carterae.AAC.1
MLIATASGINFATNLSYTPRLGAPALVSTDAQKATVWEGEIAEVRLYHELLTDTFPTPSFPFYYVGRDASGIIEYDSSNPAQPGTMLVGASATSITAGQFQNHTFEHLELAFASNLATINANAFDGCA